MRINQKSRALFSTPFSKAYWMAALKEFQDLRMLLLAAVLIAVRVCLKPLHIDLTPTLQINLGFLVNALGSMLYGPVVATVAAAVSDTLGAMIFPNGTYFLPFILTEISGSLIFALFLYRAPLSGLRITLSRFSVSFLVNIVLQTPIMLWFCRVVLGKSYMVFSLPRIIKNLVLFPFESLLLIVFLNAVLPVTHRFGLTAQAPQKLSVTKKTVAFIVGLFVVACLLAAAYYFVCIKKILS